jgi:hypothetical protein
MKCCYCRSIHLRLSHFQVFDTPRLFLLQIPMRCRSCRGRIYVNIFSAWRQNRSEMTIRKRPVASEKKGSKRSSVA